MATAEQLRRLAFLRDQLERSLDMNSPHSTLHLSQMLDSLIGEIMFPSEPENAQPENEKLASASGLEMPHLPCAAGLAGATHAQCGRGKTRGSR